LQKVRPVEYGITSIDGIRVDSTLDYANTAAMMLGVGVALALARMTSSRNPLIRGLYAAIALCCVAVLFLTASRGGIFSLGIGVLAFVAITPDRLQALFSVFLLAIPGVALVLRMQSLDGLLEVGASEAQKVADGSAFGVYLLIAATFAFILQAVYAFLMGQYELTALSRHCFNILAGVLAVLIVVTSVSLTMSRYGGVGKAYESLVEDPDNNGNIGQRLTSLSIGYREDYWKVGWASWKQNPLTGTGAGTFQFTWLKERDSDTGVKQIHNLYLEQGTETGVFAFAALLGFVGLLVGYTIRATLKSGLDGERRVLLAGLVSALLVYLISSVIEWHWYIPASTMYFFILAAVAVKLAASPEWLTPKAASPIRTVVHEPSASKTDSVSPNG
jgi:O-antigen ligase